MMSILKKKKEDIEMAMGEVFYITAITIKPYKNRKYKLSICEEINRKRKFFDYIIPKKVADLIKSQSGKNFQLQYIINNCKDEEAKKKKRELYLEKNIKLGE